MQHGIKAPELCAGIFAVRQEFRLRGSPVAVRTRSGPSGGYSHQLVGDLEESEPAMGGADVSGQYPHGWRQQRPDRATSSCAASGPQLPASYPGTCSDDVSQ